MSKLPRSEMSSTKMPIAGVISLTDIVGVGRHDRLPSSREAEVAFAVTDDRQRRGMTPILLGLLGTRARGMGIECFVAETLESNRPMIQVFMRSGIPTSTSSSNGILTLSMSPGSDATRGSRRAAR
jgi:hypothetical protein